MRGTQGVCVVIGRATVRAATCKWGVRVVLHFSCISSSTGNLALGGKFIFTTSFPVTPTRNHDHPQLVGITPTDGMVKGVS